MKRDSLAQLTFIFESLDQEMLKLKKASRDKYLKNKEEAQDEYQNGYAVGFNFGALNALEDSKHLIDDSKLESINLETQLIGGLTNQILMLSSLLKEVLALKVLGKGLTAEEVATIEEALKMVNG